jgi:hypothetical protein
LGTSFLLETPIIFAISGAIITVLSITLPKFLLNKYSLEHKNILRLLQEIKDEHNHQKGFSNKIFKKMKTGFSLQDKLFENTEVIRKENQEFTQARDYEEIVSISPEKQTLAIHYLLARDDFNLFLNQSVAILAEDSNNQFKLMSMYTDLLREEKKSESNIHLIEIIYVIIGTLMWALGEQYMAFIL